MAIHREFFGSLNTIRRLVATECEEKWDVLLDTAVPAVGAFYMVILNISPNEIIEEYLQPRPSRSDAKSRPRGHGRRLPTRYGASRWWQNVLLPDLDGMIAKRLPGAQFFEGRNAGPLERTVWTAIDIADRALFWWMIIDATNEALHVWSSGIMESRFCTQTIPYIAVGSNDAPEAVTAGGVWESFTTVEVTTLKGMRYGNNGLLLSVPDFTPIRGHCTITGDGILLEAQGSTHESWSLELVAEGEDGEVGRATSESFTIDQDAGTNTYHWSPSVSLDFDGAYLIRATINTSGTGFSTTLGEGTFQSQLLGWDAEE